MGCTGTSAHGAPPPHPSSLTLVSAGLFLSHFYHSSLSHSCCKAFFNPFLNATELSPATLIGSSLANCGSGLETVGSVCIRHEDSLWCHRSHPCNPQLLQPIPCHTNPIHILRGEGGAKMKVLTLANRFFKMQEENMVMLDHGKVYCFSKEGTKSRDS